MLLGRNCHKQKEKQKQKQKRQPQKQQQGRMGVFIFFRCLINKIAEAATPLDALGLPLTWLLEHKLNQTFAFSC